MIVKGYKCLSFLRDKGSNWDTFLCYCIDSFDIIKLQSPFIFNIRNIHVSIYVLHFSLF
jgi:hypothetical protein